MDLILSHFLDLPPRLLISDGVLQAEYETTIMFLPLPSSSLNASNIGRTDDAVLLPVVGERERVRLRQPDPLAGHNDGQDERETGKHIARYRQPGAGVRQHHGIDDSRGSADEDQQHDEGVNLAVQVVLENALARTISSPLPSPPIVPSRVTGDSSNVENRDDGKSKFGPPYLVSNVSLISTT